VSGLFCSFIPDTKSGTATKLRQAPIRCRQPFTSMRKTTLSILLLALGLFALGQTQPEADFNKAVDLLKKKNYKDAIKTFSQVITKATDQELKKLGYVYRAFSYNGISEYKNSILDLDSAIILDPDDIATYIDRGKTKGYLNDLDNAKKDFEYVLTKDSTSEQGQAALYYLGLISYQQKQDKEAIKFYDKYLILDPNNAEVYFNRGCAKGMFLKDIEGSIKDYDKAIQLNSNYAAAYANRGVAKINLLTTKGTIQPTKEQTTDACQDLKKARGLGDKTVDDMIFVYCDKK
jgi:tetratricopeptide (TPR) repeat protein